MRRLPLAALTTALLTAAALPASAGPVEQAVCDVVLDLAQNAGCTDDRTAPASAGSRQVVDGAVAAPGGSLVTTVGGAPATTRGEAANGAASWTFRVDPATVGQPFRLRPDAPVDLDVVFYDDGRGVLHQHPRTTGAFYTTSTRGEAGTVPAGSAVAVVTVADGGQAAFRYVAGR